MIHALRLITLMLIAAQPAWAQLSSGAFRGPSAELGDSSKPSPSGGASSTGAMKRVNTPLQPAGFYGILDFRHTTNEYYDETGELMRVDPALHGKLRMGGNFYNRFLDVSVGVGASKLPASQRVFQKRPDVTVDAYPYRSNLLNLMTYASALFPVRAEDLDPTEFADGDRYDRDYRRAIDATVISVGVAPNIKLEGSYAIGRPSIVVGADIWTRMYSKPVYITEADGSRELGLLAIGSPVVEKPFEDRAMRYVHQESAAVGFSPAVLPNLRAEVAGYSESRYLPEYAYDSTSSSWSYSYVPERVSFTRLKVEYELTQSTTISNELYVFRNGFFQEDRVNDQRRFRNIARLAVKL